VFVTSEENIVENNKVNSRVAAQVRLRKVRFSLARFYPYHHEYSFTMTPFDYEVRDNVKDNVMRTCCSRDKNKRDIQGCPR